MGVPATYRCDACEDRGTVQSIMGETRPCSRCRVDAFEAWLRSRALSEQEKGE